VWQEPEEFRQLVLVPADDQHVVPVGAHQLVDHPRDLPQVPLALLVYAGIDAAVQRHHRLAAGLEPDDAVDCLRGDHQLRTAPPPTSILPVAAAVGIPFIDAPFLAHQLPRGRWRAHPAFG
jgi:hypothetical protein